MNSRPTVGDPSASDAAEERRLREWREDRARVAEIEKQRRVAAAAEEREAQRKLEADARREEIQKLLPTPDSLAVARLRLVAETHQRRWRLLGQALALVGAPTLLVAGYLAFIATPLYEATTVAVVSRLGAEPSEGFGGLLSSFGGNTGLNQTFIAREYIRSDALALQLEAEGGLITQLASPEIDPLSRLRDLQPLGIGKLDRFTSFVTSSIDIQTGLITLHVFLPSAEQAVAVAGRIAQLTDQRINALADELYEQRLTLAEQTVASARERLRVAQADLAPLTVIANSTDPFSRGREILVTIDRLTREAETLRAEIGAVAAEGSGDAAQTRQMRQREALLIGRVALLRGELGAPAGNAGASTNSALIAHDLALQDVQLSEQALAAALQVSMQVAQEAALGRNRFQVVVPPTLSSIAAKPDVVRNTLLAFLLLLGLFSFGKLVLGAR